MAFFGEYVGGGDLWSSLMGTGWYLMLKGEEEEKEKELRNTLDYTMKFVLG